MPLFVKMILDIIFAAGCPSGSRALQGRPAVLGWVAAMLKSLRNNYRSLIDGDVNVMITLKQIKERNLFR